VTAEIVLAVVAIGSGVLVAGIIMIPFEIWRRR